MMIILNYISRILKIIGVEIFIIFIFILLINNYIGNVDETIKADGIGYYDYLPSLFIHHDLIRKGIPNNQTSLLYDRINKLPEYVNYHNFKADICSCGTAVLELPFFTWTYLTTVREGNSNDGYQLPFQRTIFHAAIFYLFLSIFFLKKTLRLFNIKYYVIFISQLLLVLATGVTNYANYDAGFSHIYSLFAITTFIYFTFSFFRKRNLNHFIITCLLLGLIIIIRQVNILILFFIPFLAMTSENFRDGFMYLFRKWKILVLGILLLSGVLFIQCLLWYLQTGTLYVYTYQGFGFNFATPKLFKILFSYQKGLFVYTPVLFISLFGLIWLAYKRKYYLLLTWISFFLILTYVLSSWWCWYYGASYGLRAYIDYYAVFFIPFALLLDGIALKMKFAVIILSFLTIPLNIIQTYQYKEYILDWASMDKEKYWKVFLRTADRYRGLFWKKNYDYSQYSTVKEILIGNIGSSKNKVSLIYRINSHDIPDFDKVSLIQVLIDDVYDTRNDSKIILTINESKGIHNYYWSDPYLIHFAEKHFNEWQTGLCNYEITPINDPKEKIVELQVYSEKQNNNFKNVKLKFLVYKATINR